MYTTKTENLASRFNVSYIWNKRGFGLISTLIAVFVVSTSTLGIVKMSTTFIEKWADFQASSTKETLRKNFEQLASSATNILASIEQGINENKLLDKCLKTGKCALLNEYKGLSLYNIATNQIISSGEGVHYDIAGGTCSSSSPYCPFTVQSQIKAFCWMNNCVGATGNTGFAIKYRITLNQGVHGEKKLENFIYIQRSKLKNANLEIGCSECPGEKYGFPTGPHAYGVTDDLTMDCKTNKVKKRTFYIIIP